jgi:hypothetical protein
VEALSQVGLLEQSVSVESMLLEAVGLWRDVQQQRELEVETEEAAVDR